MSTDSTRSEAQREASRINGTQSQGPITEEGKARSSQNSLKHGLRSPRIVLANEDPKDYEALLATLVREHNPVGITESHYVVQMVNAKWLLWRIDRILAGTFDNEQSLLKSAMDAAYETVTASMRQADAVTNLNVQNPGVLEYYGRESQRLERSFERAERRLEQLREKRLAGTSTLNPQPVTLLPQTPNEPENTNEPDLIADTSHDSEVFTRFSPFIPSWHRPSDDRKRWTNDACTPPKDKAA